MNKKKKTSYFVRYSKDRKWIPYRYVLYSYWFQFLKIAYQEKRKVDWKYYKEWGKREELFSQSFATFWKHNWERLFQVESEYTPVEEIKYPMKSFQVKPDGIRRYLEVYKNIEKDNYEIFDVLMKKKLVNEDNVEVGKTINKHRRESKKIIENVCIGKFP